MALPSGWLRGWDNHFEGHPILIGSGPPGKAGLSYSVNFGRAWASYGCRKGFGLICQ